MRRQTGLPQVYDEAIIEQFALQWRIEREEMLTSQAAHDMLERVFLRMLCEPAPTLNPAHVVDTARRRHPAADSAVRKFVAAAAESGRLGDLPPSVVDYVREMAMRGPLSINYPSRSQQTASHCIRDIALCRLMLKIAERWPRVPLLHSSLRRGRRCSSVAAIAGRAFSLEEDRARRIYRDQGELAMKLVRFFEREIKFQETEPCRMSGDMPGGLHRVGIHCQH